MASCNSIESDTVGGAEEGDDAPATPPSSAVCPVKVNAPPVVLTKKSTATSIPEMSPLKDFSVILDNPEGWLHMTEPYFSASLNNTNVDTTTIITEPQPFDVLCGRGGESNNARGNIQYRRLVKSYQKLYVDATRRIKPKIAQCIVFSVRQAGGRFLKRVEVTDKADKKDGSSASPGWIDVGNVKAREKTSQALRENAPDLRGPAAGGGTAGTAAATGQIDIESKPASIPRGHEFSTHPSSSAFYKQSPSLLASNTPPPVSPMNPSPLPKVGSLMHHPLFSCLSPLQKQQIMLMELQAARDNPALTHYARIGNGQGFSGQFNDVTSYPESITRTLSQRVQQQHHPQQNDSKRPASSTFGPVTDLHSDGSETSSNNSHRKDSGPRLKRLKLRIQEEAGTSKEM
jgi:hypothetical protein